MKIFALSARALCGVAAGVMLAALAMSGDAHAIELKASDVRGTPKKKPVTVLQNRYFLKAMRPEVGFIAGSFINEAYLDTNMIGFRGGMFVTEWIGFEFQYLQTSVQDSADREALNAMRYRKIEDGTVTNVDPEVNPVSGGMDFNTVVAPFYGKLNLMDKLIVYSDFYFTTGLSRVDTAQGTLNALSVGGGQRFYMFDSLSFRIDFRDRIYTEQRLGKNSRKNALSIDFGASYFFL